ncbi:hypothetical protein HQ533_05195 [Candidatus Woesearchaeota archaeon]|nr:hypothetical protein [Candidatus Woesearchaeota archaeon]
MFSKIKELYSSIFNKTYSVDDINNVPANNQRKYLERLSFSEQKRLSDEAEALLKIEEVRALLGLPETSMSLDKPLYIQNVATVAYVLAQKEKGRVDFDFPTGSIDQAASTPSTVSN